MEPRNVTSFNGSDTDVLYRQVLSWRFPLLIILMFITCIANLVVMMLTRVDVQLRTVTNRYVFSLALADLIVGFAVIPGLLVRDYFGYWPLGGSVCTLWISLDFSCCTVSMLHICLIAGDRYRAALYPVSYMQSTVCRRRWTTVAILLSWAAGFSIWVPTIFWTRHRDTDPDEPSREVCRFHPQPLHGIVQTLVVYYLPMGSMLYLYAMILRTLYPMRCLSGQNDLDLQLSPLKLNEPKPDVIHTPKEKGGNSVAKESEEGDRLKRGLLDHTAHPADEHTQDFITSRSISSVSHYLNTDIIDGGNIPVSTSVEHSRILLLPTQQRLTKCAQIDINMAAVAQTTAETPSGGKRAELLRHSRSNMRIVRTLGIIMFTFVACWLPFCIFWPISIACICLPMSFIDSMYILAYTNSALSPFLYFFGNRDFREAFRRCCCFHGEAVRRQSNTVSDQ